MERRVNKKPSTAPRGIPSCTGSGYAAVALTNNERYTRNLFCHECGTRFILDDESTVKGKAFIFPPHKVPAPLHEYRQKLEREERDAKNRNESRVASK